MLNNATGFKKIYLALGYTDLRRGVEGLKSLIHFRYDLDPYDKDTLFLFCGRRSDRIKGLLWEGDGFLLLYKRTVMPFVFNVSFKKLTSITLHPLHLGVSTMSPTNGIRVLAS